MLSSAKFLFPTYVCCKVTQTELKQNWNCLCKFWQLYLNFDLFTLLLKHHTQSYFKLSYQMDLEDMLKIEIRKWCL